MNGDSPPITPRSELCQVLTCLPEKFIVDFANGIDVVRDHVRMQRQRDEFAQRLYDGLTGQGARRQTEINACLVDGVEASLTWLSELSESLARSNLAIARVNDRVTALTGNVAALAHYSADTRQQFAQLARTLDGRLHALDQELARIDFTQKAHIHLTQVFDKWRAGRFAALSPGGRCYAALEELRWGAFGDYCRAPAGRERDAFLQQAADLATAQLAADACAAADARLGIRDVWMAAPVGYTEDCDLTQALAYLADGFDVEAAPFVTSIARQPQDLPLALPRLCDATRIARAVVNEVFPRSLDV